jgi:hypothetical protein
MAITTWSGLLTTLGRLISGDEVLTTNLPLATIEAVIALGERRIYREVKSRHNEASFSSIETADNLAAIPADWESTSVIHFGQDPLVPVPEEFVLDYGTATGDAKFFAVAGGNFTFAPAAADGTELQGRYFKRLPALSSTTLPDNALFMAEPDLFIFAALAESAPFFEDPRLPVWEARYTSIVNTINKAHQRAAYSAGRIQMRPSTAFQRVRSRTPQATSTDSFDGGSP